MPNRLHVRPCIVPSLPSARLSAIHRPYQRQRTHLTILNDATARVKGPIKKVHSFLSRYEHWPTWYPGLMETISVEGQVWKVRQKSVGKWGGSKDQWTKVELVLNDPPPQNKSRKPSSRLVFLSERSTDQLFLMSDPNDAMTTIVRFVSEPASQVVPKQFGHSSHASKMDEISRAMNKLEALLSSPNSPISDTSYEAQREGQGMSSGFMKGFRSLFGVGGIAGDKEHAPKASKNHQDSSGLSTTYSNHDPRGYYLILGFDPQKNGRLIEVDEVKKRFRARALLLHPDKVAPGKPLGRQLGQLGQSDPQVVKSRDENTEAAFKLLTEAYHVLRDNERKKAYDEGQLEALEAKI